MKADWFHWKRVRAPGGHPARLTASTKPTLLPFWGPGNRQTLAKVTPAQGEPGYCSPVAPTYSDRQKPGSLPRDGPIPPQLLGWSPWALAGSFLSPGGSPDGRPGASLQGSQRGSWQSHNISCAGCNLEQSYWLQRGTLRPRPLPVGAQGPLVELPAPECRGTSCELARVSQGVPGCLPKAEAGRGPLCWHCLRMPACPLLPQLYGGHLLGRDCGQGASHPGGSGTVRGDSIQPVLPQGTLPSKGRARDLSVGATKRKRERD